MKRMLKTLVIGLSVLSMLIVEPVTMLANVKKNLGGEVLNFAPTVDFELKEKKKVDVIVDVGNTAYTMEQANSLVNEYLRPKLQEAGYDYKLHVEKSSEGATKLYYGKPTPWNAETHGLYEYDIITKQNKKLLNTSTTDFALSRGWTRQDDFIIDPINRVLIFSSDSRNWYGLPSWGYYDLDNQDFWNFEIDNTDDSGYTIGSSGIGKVKILSGGEYVLAGELTSKNYYVRRDANNQLKASYKSYQYLYGSSWYDKQVVKSGTENQIHVSYPWGITGVKNFDDSYYFNEDDKSLNGDISIMPNRKTIIYSLNRGLGSFTPGPEFPSHQTHFHGFEEYDPKTKKYRSIYMATPDESLNNGFYNIFPLSDDRLVFLVGDYGAGDYYGRPIVGYRYVIIDDLDEITQPRTLMNITLDEFDINNKNHKVVGTVGNKLIMVEGKGLSNQANRKLYMFDVDTLEKTLIDEIPMQNTYFQDGHFNIFHYPEWYVSKKRYMTDVLDEVPYRSDAEKFYVRIDEQNLAQLSNSKSLVKTVNAFLKQQISYIQIGNDKNLASSQKLQSALSQDFMHYSVDQIGQSLNQVGKYITERKEVDLHVLVAQSGQTKAAIESSVQSLVQQLKADNIMVTPHYHYGTTSSKLQELYSDVSWNESKNQYLLFLNNASMSELSDNAYLEGVVATLSKNYAHYMQIGSSTNRSIAESIISLNEGRGKFYAGSSYSTYYAGMKQYIIDTALKSPKRVKDVLVLQHDPVTNEYSAEINVNLFYDDAENDRKRSERFKTTQDPTVYENHTGLMDGIGQYLEVPKTRFTKVGLYEMTMQAQDEPIANPAMSEYWKWSHDSLSMLRLYVHRAPVAKFSAIVRPNKSLSITDYSYDLDRYSRANRGILEWEWKWKKVEDSSWTAGKITQLANNTDYFISLRVKDLDGAWSNEYLQFVTTNPYNNPPVALFTIDPMNVSHRANATITDQSYDPDGDAIIKREWIVKKDGVELWNTTTQPTKSQLQSAATSKGLSQLGQYELSLRVTDALGELSEWHTEWLEVVNYPPLANFEDIYQTDRDTLNKLVNTTAEPDQDGDPVSYTWTLHYKDKNYNLGATKNPQFTIKSYGLGKAAIGTWEITLQARDPLGASSTLTKMFEVINHAPIARISSSPPYAYIDETYSFTSDDDDPDSEDKSSLTYYWKLTPPSGKVRTFSTKDVMNIMFDEKGKHKMEHWVEDQLGEKSEIVHVEFNVLNKRPVADFSRDPITTYRNVGIEFKSLGTDFDGWIEAYRYELLRDGLSPLTLSTDADFIRAFSSIGTYDIRHTVTDNDGASDSITKKIYIVNRAPRAEVTQPSGTSVATATEFNTLNPTIRWTMTDADNDPQVQYQLQLKNQAGTVLRTTAVTTTVNKYFTIPNGWLTEGPTYRVAVRVYDGYEWSDYSADKYFFILLNRPPVADFTIVPATKYEGDTITVTSTSTDPDNDPLQHRYVWTKPNGDTEIITTEDFSRRVVDVGQHRISLTVTDPGNLSDSISKTFEVLPLNITGHVYHTDQWKAIHEKIGNSELQFYSGEKFMLRANVTDHPIDKVTVTFNGIQVNDALMTLETNLSSTSNNAVWYGSLYDAKMSNNNTMLKNGITSFLFTVYYRNGTIKENTVFVEIIGSAYDALLYSRTK